MVIKFIPEEDIEEKEYLVTFEKCITTTMTVRAKDRDEAWDKADDMVNNDDVHFSLQDVEYSMNDIEVIDVEENV